VAIRELILFVSLLPVAAVRADVVGSQQGSAVMGSVVENSIVEEVLVEGREPRYVAPTLRDRIGRIWAPVMINGRGPYRLVLDTGASHSAVIPSVAASLGLLSQGKTVKLHGVTGSAVVPTISVDTIEVGDLLIHGATLPVVADVFGGAEGVLGSAGMKDKRIYIDFRRDRIEITHSKRERPGAGFNVVPIKMERGQLLTTTVRIGTVKTKAIIDTGAQSTIGNNALRELLIRRAKEGKLHDIIGVTLDVAQGQSIPTPPVTIGDDMVIKGLHVTFTDTFIFEHWKLTKEPALLIGMDVLGLVDALVIDYKTREMHVRMRR
jgi:predicted aspartyl protease